MKQSPSGRGAIRFGALICAFALFVGACSNDSSTDASDKTGKASNAEADAAGIFPPDIVNQPVHEGTPQRGGSLTYGLEADVLDVSPNQSIIQHSDLQLATAVFDSLITFDDEGLPVIDNTDHVANQLADELTHSDDLETWTLTLRDGVQFSNGEPVTAAQVVDHTEWVKDVGACACDTDAQNIDSVTAADDLTVVYELSEPSVNWPAKLSLGGLGLITESAAREAADNPENPDIDHLVGAGPFHYASKTGDSYRVEANEHYYGTDPDNDGAQLPYLDAIEFRILADSVTRLQAVESGGVDIMQTGDTKNLVGAKDSSEVSVQPVAGTSSTVEILNLTHPPFGVEPEPGEDAQETARRALDDPTASKARLAFAKSIDRNEINQKYYGGARIPAYGFFPSANPYFDPDGQVPRFDLPGARELVSEVDAEGVAMDVTRMCIETPEGHGVFQILQEQGKEAGIDLSFEPVDQAKLVENVLGGSGDIAWDVTCFRSSQMADPDGIYNGLYTGGPANVAKYSRDDVDEWLDQARSETDYETRKALYDKIQEQVASDVVILPRLFDYFGNVYRNDISGLSAPSPAALGTIAPGGLYKVS